jgi:hypothetical protein
MAPPLFCLIRKASAGPSISPHVGALIGIADAKAGLASPKMIAGGKPSRTAACYRVLHGQEA